MARGHRSGDERSIRLFEMSAKSPLAKLDDRVFDNEDQMHRLIEDNIETLFPGLVFLTREFRGMAGGELRPDTVAFDAGLNTFVALEYKNRRNTEAVDQARTYLDSMEEYGGDLVLLYNGKVGSARDKSSFEWSEMYAIIMAPEFGKFQIRGAGKDSDVELYKIRVYGDNVLLVERVGGGHQRAATATSAPSTRSKTARAAAAAPSPRPSAKATRTDRLYDTIRAKMLAAFPGAEERKKKFYNGFRYPGDSYFCTMAIQKSKIWLSYSGKHAASELEPGGFVQDVQGWGVGKYRSEIRNEADFEKALAILKGLHAADRSGGASPSSAQQASRTHVFSDELLANALQPQSNRTIHTAILAARPPIAEGGHTVLTYGGIDAENRLCILQQEIVLGSFSEVAETVKRKQDQGRSINFHGVVVALVDAASTGASLLAALRNGGVSNCIGLKLTDGRMDAAYNNLRTELETGRAFLQDSDPSYREELFEQLRGIVWSDDGAMAETKGSDRAASLAIAVWGARQTKEQNHKSGGGIARGIGTGNTTKRVRPGRVRLKRLRSL